MESLRRVWSNLCVIQRNDSSLFTSMALFIMDPMTCKSRQ